MYTTNILEVIWSLSDLKFVVQISRLQDFDFSAATQKFSKILLNNRKVEKPSHQKCVMLQTERISRVCDQLWSPAPSVSVRSAGISSWELQFHVHLDAPRPAPCQVKCNCFFPPSPSDLTK